MYPGDAPPALLRRLLSCYQSPQASITLPLSPHLGVGLACPGGPGEQWEGLVLGRAMTPHGVMRWRVPSQAEIQAEGVGMTEGAAEKSGEGGRWEKGRRASRVGQCPTQRVGLRPCCPHLLVDVDGLWYCSSCARIAGYLQQTLVG